MTPCGRAVAALAIMAIVAIAAPDVDAVMAELPEGVPEAAWSEEGSPQLNLFQTEVSPESLRRKEAVADAHVREDQASLSLSSDAQALEHLKGQMSLEVIHAKEELAANPSQPSASAHRAAKIAKKVLQQTSQVKKDQSKEKLAKLKVAEAERLLQEEEKTAVSVAQEKAGIKSLKSSHLHKAAGKLKGALGKLTAEADKTYKKGAKNNVKVPDKSKLPTHVQDPATDKDPVSRELGLERDKYRISEHETAKAVEKDKHDVAMFETIIQDLSDKLTKAKSHLMTSRHALHEHMQAHSTSEHLFQKYTDKESHYKTMHALKAKIARQEDNLRLQQMKIRDSKEMLTKSLNKEQDLVSLAAKKQHRFAKPAAGLPSSPKAPLATPAVSAAVDAVSANLGHQNIAQELAPKIEALKAKGLKGAALKSAIDSLVAKTVKAKVGAAFQQDPTVASAVRKAARQVQAKRAHATTDLTLASAKKHVSTLHQANQKLQAAENKLNNGLDEEEMIQQLEEEWGRAQ